MAEYVFKVDDSATYEDGDVLEVFTRLRIRCCHAQRICFEKHPVAGRRGWARLNSNGLLDNDDVARDYEEAVRQTRIERLNTTHAKLVVLATGQEIEFDSNVPFVDHRGRTVAMDIPRYFAGKLRVLHMPGGCGQAMFGVPGREIIYGGSRAGGHARMDTIWNAIETKTPKREVDHALAPAGVQDLKSHLFVPTEDMPESEAAEMTLPTQLFRAGVSQWDGGPDGLPASQARDGRGPNPPDDSGLWTPVMDKKRQYRGEWASAANLARLARSVADIRDKGKSVDVRASVAAFKREDILYDKLKGSAIGRRG